MKERDFQERKLDALRKIMVDVETVADVLPEAVRASIRKDKFLGQSLEPVISEVLDESVARHKEKMVTALYPLLGAMVRRYVVESFRDYLQTVTSTIDRALSAEGIKWRLQSWRTGVPLSEIALRNSVLYRVEHVFLIHKATSVPLAHIRSPQAVATDKILFSGMVGAIIDFVRDSFRDGQSVGLRSIEVSGFNIWFEESPLAVVAIVIRGEAPPQLRNKLKAVSERLQEHYEKELRGALADEISLMGYESVLRDAVLEEMKAQSSKPKYAGKAIMGAAAAIAVFALGYWAYGIYTERHRDTRFEDYVSSLTSHTLSLEESQHAKLLQTYLTKLRDIDGRIIDEASAPSIAARIADAYVQGRGLGRSFIVVIEHSPALKQKAASWAGWLTWRLYLNGIYQFQLIRTIEAPVANLTVHVLPEKTEAM